MFRLFLQLLLLISFEKRLNNPRTFAINNKSKGQLLQLLLPICSLRPDNYLYQTHYSLKTKTVTYSYKYKIKNIRSLAYDVDRDVSLA